MARKTNYRVYFVGTLGTVTEPVHSTAELRVIPSPVCRTDLLHLLHAVYGHHL
jgi:hypothetical protein